MLYPPHSLDKIVTNKDLFIKLAPSADDVWFWAMALLQGTKYSVIDDGYKMVEEIDATDLGLLNTVNANGGNDDAIKNVMDYFSKIKEVLSLNIILK